MNEEIESCLQELVQEIAEDKGFTVHLFECGKGELWNHSYYVETVGSVSEENIRRYIEHQSKAY